MRASVALSLLFLLAVSALAGCRAEAPDGVRGPGEPGAPGGSAETGPPVEVRASVDRAVATTGDLITYRIEIEHDPAFEVEVPEAGSEIAGFRIVDAGREPSRRRQDRVLEERWYTLRADLVGSYVLPPVEVGYRRALEEGATAPVPDVGSESGAVRTSEIFVEVESVLPDAGAEGGEAADIRDIKPLRRIERPIDWRWAAAAALALAAAAAGYLLWRRRSRPPAPVEPPHLAAFRALEALRGLDVADPEALRRFYFGLSEALRAYIEDRFGLNATDLTSEEILLRTAELEGLGTPELESLERFLVDTDRVKFAEHRPGEAEISATYERALGFVEATRPPETELAEAA